MMQPWERVEEPQEIKKYEKHLFSTDCFHRTCYAPSKQQRAGSDKHLSLGSAEAMGFLQKKKHWN